MDAQLIQTYLLYKALETQSGYTLLPDGDPEEQEAISKALIKIKLELAGKLANQPVDCLLRQ